MASTPRIGMAVEKKVGWMNLVRKGFWEKNECRSNKAVVCLRIGEVRVVLMVHV